jgi:hypothetical protein
MTRIIRLSLVLILALALPFHAAYGLGMAQCMAFMKAGQTAAVVQSAPGHGAHGTHGFATAQVHADHGHEQVGHESQTAHDNDGSGPHCGTCTACCTSVGISGSAPLSVSASGYVGPDPLSQQQPKSFKPSRLDRPPLVS